MPQTRNKFSSGLPRQEERKRRLYLLDSDPPHSLQVFGVPQYLPKEIFGFNNVNTVDLIRHHTRVIEGIKKGRFTFGFDEDGVEKSLAFIFGVSLAGARDVLAGSKEELSEQPAGKKIRCLQIYYEDTSTEQFPPGVFDTKEGDFPGTGTQWSKASKSEAETTNALYERRGLGGVFDKKEDVPVYQRRKSPKAGAAAAAPTTAAESDDEDGPTRGNTPVAPSPIKTEGPSQTRTSP